MTDCRNHILMCTMLLLTSGTSRWCFADDGTRLSDEWFSYSIMVDGPWQRAPLSGFMVPGVVRCGWSGDNAASIVIFVQEPGKVFSARELLTISEPAMKSQPGTAVRVAEVRPVAGREAMWMLIDGPGTGGAIDGKGDVKTTQHWVAVPHDKNIIVALLTCPTNDYAGLQKSFESAIISLKFTGPPTTKP